MNWCIVDIDDTVVASFHTEEEARNSLHRYPQGLTVKYLEDEDDE